MQCLLVFASAIMHAYWFVQIMRNAADMLTPVTLELGGKDAFIVCEDADVEHV